MTLLIMAAGMGSRYGGLKQLDPISSHGEFIVDFSIYDAVCCGFDRVVFIIKEENLLLFKNSVGDRISRKAQVLYCFQDVNDVPRGVNVPPTRTKPWGTAHAVLAAKNIIDDNFVVINADDFYGKESFENLYNFLKVAKENEFAMSSYNISNTLTENGYVSRGVCEIDNNGFLKTVTERVKIQRNGDEIQYFEDEKWTTIDDSSLVSMNCFGFTPLIFKHIEDGLSEFFEINSANLDKCEYFLPSVVQSLIDKNICTVKILPTTAKWYGVTYKEDKKDIEAFVENSIKNGLYPDNLWK